MSNEALPEIPSLPDGIVSARADNGNGLDMHYLEAGPGDGPCLLLLHGFPELAYSWRKVMTPLAAAGYRVIAPDQRGYGRTTGWAPGYRVDLQPYGFMNLVRDALGLLWALGLDHVTSVIGHDFGSPVAAWCALLRPEVFRSVVLLSAPFPGPPAPPAKRPAGRPTSLTDALLALKPPRKHYQWYFSGETAASDMLSAARRIGRILRPSAPLLRDAR